MWAEVGVVTCDFLLVSTCSRLPIVPSPFIAYHTAPPLCCARIWLVTVGVLIPSISVDFERAWPWPCCICARACSHRAPECHWTSTYQQLWSTGRLNIFLLVAKLHVLGPCLCQELLQCVVVLRRAWKAVHLSTLSKRTSKLI